MSVIFLICCIAALISKSLSENTLLSENDEVYSTTIESITPSINTLIKTSTVSPCEIDINGIDGTRQWEETTMKVLLYTLGVYMNNTSPRDEELYNNHGYDSDCMFSMGALIYSLSRADVLYARSILPFIEDRCDKFKMFIFNKLFTFPQEDVLNFFRFLSTNYDCPQLPANVERSILGLVEKYEVLKYASNGNNTDVFNWLYEKGAINKDTLRSVDVEHLMKTGLLRKSYIEKLLSRDGSPLHSAAQIGSLSFVMRFIEEGSKISAVDSNNKTPLEYAVEGDHEDIVEYLLSKGADINISLGPQGTLLHIAVINKNKNMVEYLLEAGISVDSIDSEGQTPLYLAAKAQDYEIARSLWRRGAEVNFENEDGDSLLHIAAKHGDVKAIEGLIEMGACVDSSNDGMTPLYRAAQYGNLDAMKTLLENSADINYGPFEGNKLIHVAARNNHSLAVESLLDMGVDVDLRGKYEFTALHWASRVGFYNIIEVLLKRNANIEARIDIGRTPLHEGAFWGQIKSCYTLVAYGASTKALDNSKRRPSELARDSGHLTLYRILRDFENNA